MTKKQVLLGGVSALAVGLMLAPAFAQDAVETVVVTGIRASLQSAQAIKQNSDQVVDSITAVDIGALPDRNIAEALQRVPGVTMVRGDTANDMVRMGSTGTSVFIRGLSWVKSLVNGRDEFTAKNGRSLSFGDISSDLMQAVNVYKSTTADQVEGAVGGTVDLVTRKPFDSDGLKIGMSADVTYGDLIDKAVPSGNFMVSDRWNTKLGEFGALVSIDYQTVNNRTTGINLAPYGCWDQVSATDPVTHVTTNTNTHYAPKDSTYGNCSAGTGAGDIANVPEGFAWRQLEFTEKRLASNVVLQWRPSDKTEITLFAMNTFAYNQDIEHYVYSKLTYDQAKASTYRNGYWVGGSANFDSTDLRGGTGHNRDTDVSLNVKYNPTDNLEITADVQAVESSSPYRNMTYFTSAVNAPTFTLDVSGNKPKFSYTDSSSVSSASNYYYSAAMDHLDYNVGHALNARLDAKYSFEGDGVFGLIKSVQAGFRTEHKKAVSRSTGYNWGELHGNGVTSNNEYITLDGVIHSSDGVFNSHDGNTYTTTKGAANLEKALSYTQLFNYAKIFGNSLPNLYVPGSALGSMNTAKSYSIMSALQPRNSDYFAWASPGTQNWAQWIPYATEHNCAGDDVTCLAAYQNSPGGNSAGNQSSDQNEQTFAEYVQVNYAADQFLGYDVPIDGNIGMRVVRTEDQIGAGLLAMPTIAAECLIGTDANHSTSCTDWQSAYDYLVPAGTATTDINKYMGVTINRPAVKHGYTNLLPSINFRAKLSDTLQLRMAYYETIVRPDFSKTYTSASLAFNFQTAAGTVGQFSSSPSGYGGNPFLKPMHATNYDASVEWYFNASGSLTMSLFHKDLSNYIYTATTTMPITDPVTQKILNFNYTTYVNGAKGKVEGFELAYQQFFDNLPGALSGLGVQANYTKIYNSGGHNAGSDLTNSVALAAAADTSLPLEGMSNDSYNIAIMYGKYGIDARLAWNWRSSYLSASSDSNAKIPVWMENYGELDGSVFYTFLEHYKIGMQATNLLAAPFHTDMGYKNFHPRTNWIDTDRKFSLVLRANW